MLTSFHYQPEAQHPNYSLSTSCRPILPHLLGQERRIGFRSHISASTPMIRVERPSLNRR